MKQPIRITYFLLVFLCLLAPSPVSALNLRSVDIQDATIKIVLLSDGRAEVEERFSITSDRDFRHTSIRLEPAIQGEQKDLRLAVAQHEEDGTPDLYSEVVLYDPDGKEGRSPFSYELNEDGSTGSLFLTGKFLAGHWHIRLNYTIERAVQKSDSRALFSFAPLINLQKKRIISTALSVELPADTSDLTVIPISEVPFQTSISERLIRVRTLERLEARDDMTLLISLPEELFSQLAASENPRSHDERVESAQARASKALNQRQTENLIRSLIPVLTLAGLLLWGIYFLYFEREGFARKTPPNFAVWPSGMPPSPVAMLLGVTRMAPLILATLLRLTSHKELSFDGYVFTWKHPNRADYSQFTRFEIFLLHWLFKEIADADAGLSAIQIEEAAKNPKTSEAFQKSSEEMAKVISHSFARFDLYDQRKSWYALLFGIIFGISFAILALLLGLLGSTPLAIALILPGLLFFLSGQKIRHLNKKGVARRNECRLYRLNLSDMQKIYDSNKEIFTEIESTILALPHAVALGKIEPFLDNLSKLPTRKFIDQAQALLKIYGNRNPQTYQDEAEEVTRLTKELERLKEIILTSLSILDGIMRKKVY